jgi:hypothetical protein
LCESNDRGKVWITIEVYLRKVVVMIQRPFVDDVAEFNSTFGLIERALRHAGILQKGHDRAFVDWKVFADSLGDSFFKRIQKSGDAAELISSPPGELMNRAQRAVWEKQPALDSVKDLFIRGVCKVRANLAHHEKFVGDEADQRRDHLLVQQALYVLKEAQKANEDLQIAIKKIS